MVRKQKSSYHCYHGNLKLFLGLKSTSNYNCNHGNIMCCYGIYQNNKQFITVTMATGYMAMVKSICIHHKDTMSAWLTFSAHRGFLLSSHSFFFSKEPVILVFVLVMIEVPCLRASLNVCNSSK